MTFIIQNFGPNLARLRIEKGVSQTQLAEDLGIGKQSVSDYEKQKSYPTFANLDKIAEYFNATPTQLFGTSKEIELEKSVLESNEYSDKVSEILKAVKYIENFLEANNYTQKMETSCILIQLLRKEHFITNMNLVLL